MEQIITCKYCNKNFKVSKSRIKWGRGIYCSRKCQYKGRKVKRDKRKCPVCKKIFEIERSIKKRFCSPNCSYKARSLGLVKRTIVKPYKNKKGISDWRRKKCIICKINYITSKRTQKHCSKECLKTTQSIKISGNKNYFYINGNNKNKRSYRGDNWNLIRKQIYKRDNYICQDCGIKCISKKYLKNKKESNRIIQCHHIDYNKKNNKEENLITLCLKCHLKRHR